ncbi:EF-P 5-aminopentanol modification-associated protein YfmH [Liquorilactobacillus sicerae]|uniref:EF-P 5-aminopentanol modification-associated protein YfmH n=1 Tax=Liquorilactobacillus sicerae TaxID=1416943 RepID=UPI00248134AD|nr:pitrilysin family protein [Liquorilactobacillus sicerae]
MKIIDYPEFREHECITQLTNGLTVKIFPKKGFHKTAAMLRVEFGSIDETFAVGQAKAQRTFPAGVAHFLEHKMFEQPDHDAFETFSHLGADANAFTTYTNTNYLFTTVFNVRENLETLLDFVQEPYFQPAAIEREKKIIGQEIKMYADDPSWQLYAGILANLYPKHPLAKDIAGTLTSIQQITATDLLECYQAFYHPTKMTLMVAGAVDPNEVLDWIVTNQAQKKFPPAKKTFRANLTAQEIQGPTIKNRTIILPTQRVKVAFGVKGTDSVEITSKSGLKYSLALEMASSLYFGELSDNYQRLYQQGLIDDSFSFEIQVDRGFHYLVLTGETESAAKLFTNLEQIFSQTATSSPITANQFEMAKRDLLGGEIAALDSVSSILNQDQGLLFDQATIFDQIKVIEELDLITVVNAWQCFLQTASFSKFEIDPRGENQ